MSSSRAALALVAALALGGCGAAGDAAGPPLAPAGNASPSGYAASVRKGADAMRDFARETRPALASDPRRPRAALEAARDRFADAVRESSAAQAPALLADADRRLVSAWRDVDVAMRDVVGAAEANDPERYERARGALVEVVARVERAADRFAIAAAA